MLHEITQEHRQILHDPTCMYVYVLSRESRMEVTRTRVGEWEAMEENGKMLVKDHKVSVRK